MTKECRVWTIKDNYRLGDDMQSKVLAFAFGLSAEIERNLISQRTKEAMHRLAEEGTVRLGRPDQVGAKYKEQYKLYKYDEKIRSWLEKGLSRRQIARRLKVSKNTVFQYCRLFIDSEYMDDEDL